MSHLEHLGWNPEFEAHWNTLEQEGREPARVVEEQRDLLTVAGATGRHPARLCGSLRNSCHDRTQLPTVGDWVAVDTVEPETLTIVRDVLPRRSSLARGGVQGTTEGQMIAANIDFAVVQTSCNDDFNPRRLERTLALLWESGAQPVLLLNKCDLLDDPEELVSEAEALAPGVPVIAVSALRKLGIDALERFLRPGRTTVLLGSSGVGKSTLVNTLVGQDVLAVAAIREGDSRGRHTTSHRELVTLPGGALLIDTPGMRELALWDCEEGLTATFPEIEELGKHCRFVDCRHRDEPGCAITAALEDGTLSAERFASYQKLQRELTYLAKRQDKKAQSEQRRVNRRFAKAMRRRNRHD